MYLLYSAALAVAAALTFPYFFIQGLRHGKYLANFRARWGQLPSGMHAVPGCIWLHAVSVGEVMACPKLVAEMRRRWPDRRVYVSTVTETGFAAAQKRLGADGVFYCPFDFAFAVRRVLAHLRPALLVVVETELWPNLLREARASGAKVALVNARISDRSFPRYRALRFFFGDVLRQTHLVLAQSEEDARRLREIGAAPDTLAVTGTLKYDLTEPAAPPEWLAAQLAQWSAPGVFVAGSTAEGEEEHVLAAWAGLPGKRLIIAPRRPERFDRVADMIRSRGIRLVRRSELVPGGEISGEVLLVDTVGELAGLYTYAEVVFVGGSLVDHGGQNPLEAAWFAKPVVAGPSMSNFRDIAAGLLAVQAMATVRSPGEFPAVVGRMFADPAAARAMGLRARGLLDANRGATARTVEALGRIV